MAGVGTAAQVSKMSMMFSAAFAVIGIGLLYLAIMISDASDETKVIWASGLSLAVAFVFLLVWSMAKDSIKTYERELKRKISP
jgi:membrane protein CcdC involved in cytochrome C biogenesis